MLLYNYNVVHPRYAENVVMVMADVVKMGEEIKAISPKRRIYMKDFPECKTDQLMPFEEDVLWVGRPYPFDEPVTKRIGHSTKQLIESKVEVTILNLKEYDELI